MLSMVIAHYNRKDALNALLSDLDTQTLTDFEVIVVDDGSREPFSIAQRRSRYPLRLIRQDNAGAAAARHRGISEAQGEIIVIVDDDMRLGPDFLAAHARAHAAGATLVLGLIAPDAHIGKKPLFERMHQHMLARLVAMYEADPRAVKGTQVCTGNVSFRRADYLAVGGFDRALARSEDRELGLRLEKAGAKLVFCAEAKVVHESDHVDSDMWMKRNFLYGIYDTRIAKKHPDVPSASPWHFLALVNRLSVPILLTVVAAPDLGRPLAHLVLSLAERVDRAGLPSAALAGATLAYGIAYFHGVREEEGSLLNALRDWRKYARKVRGNR